MPPRCGLYVCRPWHLLPGIHHRTATRSDLAHVLCRVRDQRQVARALDGLGKAPLVLGAGSRPPARQDAAALVHVPRKR